MVHARRHTPFFCFVVLFLGIVVVPTSYAEGVRLDSLWGRIVGNVNALLFTPDSKQLLIADDVGIVRVVDALTGEQRDSFPNR